MEEEPGLRRMWSRVLRKLRARNEGQDVEDLLHSAYVRLRLFERENQVANREAFLLHAARNIAVDDFRRRSVRAAERSDAECLVVADESPLQDEAFDARVRLLHVEEGLRRLPSRTREVFQMHRLDSLKYREIAERLGISQSAVEKHIARAALFLGEWTKDWRE